MGVNFLNYNAGFSLPLLWLIPRIFFPKPGVKSAPVLLNLLSSYLNNKA